MKGKGSLTTYWLHAADTNPLVNKQGLEALDVEVKQVLYNADFGTKERRSDEKMGGFSPAKMQKVALSLDKLAMNVLRRTTRMSVTQKCSVPSLTEDEPVEYPPHITKGLRGNKSLDLSDHNLLPQATEQVYDALTGIVDRFNEISQDAMKREIARTLSSRFESYHMPNDELLEVTETDDTSTCTGMSQFGSDGGSLYSF